LYFQEHGRSVNRSIVVEECEDMGRIRSAQNFALTLAGKEAPLNTPDQALALMKIIDATYESAKSGKPVEINWSEISKTCQSYKIPLVSPIRYEQTIQ